MKATKSVIFAKWRFCLTPVSYQKYHQCLTADRQIVRREGEEEDEEVISPFFCWKEWGMMGPVVKIFRVRGGKSSGLLISSEVLRSVGSFPPGGGMRDAMWGEARRGKARRGEAAGKRQTVLQRVRVFVSCRAAGWSGEGVGGSLTGWPRSLSSPGCEWQLELEGRSCRQCTRARTNLCTAAAAVQCCWSLVSVIGEQDGNASGKAGRGWSESSRLSTLRVSETVHRASAALRADRPPAL